eukprot:1599520-Lingulodinium_polyedra.AAC.1
MVRGPPPRRSRTSPAPGGAGSPILSPCWGGPGRGVGAGCGASAGTGAGARVCCVPRSAG